jgi:hypothetical protein
VVVPRAVVERVGVSEAEGVGDVELSPCELVLSSSEVVRDAVVGDAELSPCELVLSSSEVVADAAVDDGPCELLESSAEDVSVVRLTAVVVESVTMMALVMVLLLLVSS